MFNYLETFLLPLLLTVTSSITDVSRKNIMTWLTTLNVAAKDRDSTRLPNFTLSNQHSMRPSSFTHPESPSHMHGVVRVGGKGDNVH